MRKTKAKFRWLALLLAMVSLFGVLAIPASADYYYAMKVSVYYKDRLRHLSVIPLGGNNITKDLTWVNCHIALRLDFSLTKGDAHDRNTIKIWS